MKTYLISVTECYDKSNDINERKRYIVPAESEEDAKSQIMRNLTPPMLMDGDGYPESMEITSPISI